MVSIPIPSRDQGRSATGPVAVPPLAVTLRTSWLHATRLGRATSLALFYSGQVLLMAALFMVYRLGRQLAVGREPQALANARDVWSFERLIDLPDESALQRLALHSTELLELANRFYIGVHFPASIAFLLWVMLRHRDAWPRVRMVILASTGAALVIHMLYPLAPPRFLPQVLPHVSLVDTGAVFGPSPYSAGDKVANQYAAMPSLHVGWSIIVAWGTVTILRARARWLMILHPVLTVIVVVITANHYWMDGVIGGGLVALSVLMTRPEVQTRLRSVSRTAWAGVRSGAQVPVAVQVPFVAQAPAGAAQLQAGAQAALEGQPDRGAAAVATKSPLSVPAARNKPGGTEATSVGLPDQRALVDGSPSRDLGGPSLDLVEPPGAEPASGRAG
ncbi:phosphatase PAP2 family protein [Parafrankia sp. EUN1f]|uniref:phosphatase PAP2 family protein n=1 Tax=Parafrankia sp. EUN1f TaxID=102897 RepID=UPI0001C43933|nr:phosphatase PAP2 family protein [Parafrankia sp. EUN1f]EFC86105.1 hypothetical protein FrEUN1fDRAFT_0716 [Parafrankia sp. EUN1f]